MLLSGALTLGAESSGFDYYSVHAVTVFADWLFEQGDYARAAIEYQRAYVEAGEGEGESLLFRAARSSMRGGDNARAIVLYLTMLERYPSGEFGDDARYDCAYLYFKIGEYEASNNLLLRLGTAPSVVKAKALLLRSINFYIDGKIDDSVTIARDPAVAASPDLKLKADMIADLASKTLSEKEISPVAAGVLSAIVPGLGRMYAERPGDGIFSFLTIGSFAGLAVWGFYEDGPSSTRGWIYAAIGSVFYFGNIYGSVIAANNRNEDRKLLLQKEAVRIGESFAP